MPPAPVPGRGLQPAARRVGLGGGGSAGAVGQRGLVGRRGVEVPAEGRGQQEQQRRHQRHAQLLQDVAGGHVQVAPALQRAQQRRQRGVGNRLRDRLGQRRQRHEALGRRQRRHQVRLDLGQHDHVDHVQPGQHDAGEEGAGVQLHHRHAGGGAVDDEHHARRDQDAQAAAGGDGAGRDAHVVAAAQHLRQRQQAHQRDHRADDAGGSGEHRAGEQRGHGQRAGHARHRQVQALEQLLDQVGALDQVAHEDEQRDRDEHVVAHHLEGRLHHQRQRLRRCSPRRRSR